MCVSELSVCVCVCVCANVLMRWSHVVGLNPVKPAMSWLSSSGCVVVCACVQALECMCVCVRVPLGEHVSMRP